MLIGKVTDDDGAKGESCDIAINDDSHEYQTASDLFDFMAKNQNFSMNDGDTLTPRDLVLLYKNIDLGTKLMTDAKELQDVKPNQYVETVVYNDDSDESDTADIYSDEDIHNIFLINKERLDLFNNKTSINNTLCHKFGDLEIQSSINSEYDKQFLFRDPYIKEQLKNFNLMTNSNQFNGTIIPTSLLDYICCKRLEDNYKFYMDNIILYVQNTIEQLKRISNGDYLTDKVKEKWREVESENTDILNNTKALATSTSIPLHVECKIGGQLSTWDDIVHSAVDIRSLSKILEKKIFLEIPKLISGSYKLFSKCDADNLIVSCKKDNEAMESKQSRVDVMFQLKRSETGHVISNINSIMILQAVPKVQAASLPLMYKDKEDNDDVHYTNEGEHVKITELTENEDVQDSSATVANDSKFQKDYSNIVDDASGENEIHVPFDTQSDQEYTTECHSLNNNYDEIRKAHGEPLFELCPNDLCMTMQNMVMQSVLPEEEEDITQSIPIRKKSPKVRIKSPYENKSHYIEEKKRRKLLEIRERRERKKMALAENCKITKHKYGKGSVMPQASSSVTKLSISNKSFYNSIYGQSENIETKKLNNRNRKSGTMKEIIGVDLGNLDSEREIPSEIAVTESKKFINRSYYLDDTVTEMMLVNMKQQEEEKDNGTCSASTTSDYRTNLNILSQLIASSDSDINVINCDNNACSDRPPKQQLNGPGNYETNKENDSKILELQNSVNIVPSNTPKNVTTIENQTKELKKIASSIECRKSIDKIYQLMKDLENQKGMDERFQNNEPNKIDVTVAQASSSVRSSDSGTSLKHHLTSSNPSTFSFDKNNNTEVSKYFNKRPVISKVIISSKSQIPRIDMDKAKRERKTERVSINPKTQENPLKAISQLLHEFENVQKKRIKSGTDQKSVKKTDIVASSNDVKTLQRQGLYKQKSRLEQNTDSAIKYDKFANTSKDRKLKQVNPKIDLTKSSYQPAPTDNNNKKKIKDILDEEKEARGEAVKGPSKFNSRLNSLAQPKRIYVQAHSEEYQTRYGKNLITDRLQRLAATPTQFVVDRATGLVNTRNKTKRSNNDTISPRPLKLPLQSELPIERQTLKLRSQQYMYNSLESKEQMFTHLEPSYKVINEPEVPELLKKKMIAVESYVKNHYSPTSLSTIPNELRYTQKTRTPLLPSDIDIASNTSSLSHKESMEVGSKLHSIINSMVKSTSPDLEILEECCESSSKLSKSLSRCDERISVDSEYITSTIEEVNVLTSNYNSDSIRVYEDQSTDLKKLDCKLCNLPPLRSVVPLERNKQILDRPLSLGAFSKHVKFSGLSPKSSVQKIFFLQSNDTNSMLVKASLSKNLQTDVLLDLTIPILSKHALEWSFTNIPKQITTVGFAFPEYGNCHCGSPSLCKLFDDVSKPGNHDSTISKPFNTGHKSHAEELSWLDQDVQVELDKFTIETTEPNSNTNNKDLNKMDVDKMPISNSDNFRKVETSTNKEENKDPININLDKKEESSITSKSPDSINYTTSLDILVGLLNEIKKITTCQARITNNENEDSKELQTILKKSLLESPFQSSCFDEISANELSVTSLEKLRSLESHSSLYSYYLSDNEGSDTFGNIKPNISNWYDTRNGTFCKSIYADKEVNVDIIEKEYISRLTDVPSIVFPITINSTTVTDSIVEGCRQSSTHSLYSVELYSTSSHYPTMNDVVASSRKVIDITKTSDILDDKLPIVNNNSKVMSATNAMGSFRRDRPNSKSVQKRVKLNNFIIKNSEFDPTMKMKRDILVTVYSMLVLTVFAALSFPEIMYHV